MCRILKLSLFLIVVGQTQAEFRIEASIAGGHRTKMDTRLLSHVDLDLSLPKPKLGKFGDWSNRVELEKTGFFYVKRIDGNVSISPANAHLKDLTGPPILNDLVSKVI